MADSTEIASLLVEAGVLPPEMPQNYTYDQVREIVCSLSGYDEEQVNDAISTLSKLEITGPLQSAVFIKHHLAGEHETAVDRVITNEETGERYAVLTYPEGELPVKLNKLPRGVREGRKLRYTPSVHKFVTAGKRPKKDGRVRDGLRR